MGIINDIISIILTLGIIQGLIFGLILIFIDGKKNRSTLFLGMFVLTYALELIIPILKYSDIIIHYPRLKLLPVDFRWLTIPLFYVYVQKISILPKVKNIYYLLIPGVIALILNTIIFFQSVASKEIIRNSTWFKSFDFLGLIFSFFISIKILLFINKHTTELKNQYSFTQSKELQWAKLFLLIGIIFIIISFGLNSDSLYFILLMSIVNVALLYWVSIKGIRQQNIQTLIQLSDSNKNNQESEKVTIQNKKMDIDLFKKIEQYIILEKMYTQANLTITDVARGIKEQPKRVSGLVNLIAGKNFKSYINSFRVAEAKKLLKNKKFDYLSIEGVGFEVGFQSKSTFYEAFKKETGTTPFVFKSQN